jgi:hypothetical protein
VSAYQAAKLPTQAAAIASAVAAAPSGASVALRVVAGASWPALGVLVGLTLLQIYLDSNKTAAIQEAAAGWTAARGRLWRCSKMPILSGSSMATDGCRMLPAAALQPIAQGFLPSRATSRVLFTAGPYCAQETDK